jgi:hypothetical protein
LGRFPSAVGCQHKPRTLTEDEAAQRFSVWRRIH